MIAGIRVDTSLDLRVSENTITNIAPPTDFQNPAAGVLVVIPLAHIDVSTNLIRRQLTPNDDNSPWEAVRILGLGSEPAGKLQGTSFTNLTADGQVNAISSLAASDAAPFVPAWSTIPATATDAGRWPKS